MVLCRPIELAGDYRNADHTILAGSFSGITLLHYAYRKLLDDRSCAKWFGELLGISSGSTSLPSELRTTYSRGQPVLSSCTSCLTCPSGSREATKISSPSPSLVR